MRTQASFPSVTLQDDSLPWLRVALFAAVAGGLTWTVGWLLSIPGALDDIASVSAASIVGGFTTFRNCPRFDIRSRIAVGAIIACVIGCAGASFFGAPSFRSAVLSWSDGPSALIMAKPTSTDAVGSVASLALVEPALRAPEAHPVPPTGNLDGDFEMDLGRVGAPLVSDTALSGIRLTFDAASGTGLLIRPGKPATRFDWLPMPGGRIAIRGHGSIMSTVSSYGVAGLQIPGSIPSGFLESFPPAP